MGALSADDNNAAADSAWVYRQMLLIRRFEEKAGQLYAIGVLPDEIKLCIGREALITGLLQARNRDDPIVVGRRSHGFVLGLGITPDTLMAELAKPVAGLLKIPSQRPPNTIDSLAHFYCCQNGNRIITQWAVSLALAQRGAQHAPVVFAILDGDTLTKDALVRAVDISQRQHLRTVFVVDQATPLSMGDASRAGLLPSDSPIALARVDGIDHAAVHAACRNAAARAREDIGPQGLIVSTQAFRGHGDKSSRRASIAGRRADIPDPVQLARKRLLEVDPQGGDLAKSIEDDVRKTVAEACSAVTQPGYVTPGALAP